MLPPCVLVLTTCSHCLCSLDPSALHYRFAIALEGEQRALDADTPKKGEFDELAELMKVLEAGPEDPTFYEDHVHWERSGILCSACRAEAMAFFNARRPETH